MSETKKSVLDEMRRKITSLGGSEFDAVENQPALQEMWNQLQVLREEMNEAKKAAAAEAAKPYQETINQIESKYAFMLRMVS